MIAATVTRMGIAKARYPLSLVVVAPEVHVLEEMWSSHRQINAPIFMIDADVGFGDWDSRRAAGWELRAVSSGNHGWLLSNTSTSK